MHTYLGTLIGIYLKALCLQCAYCNAVGDNSMGDIGDKTMGDIDSDNAITLLYMHRLPTALKLYLTNIVPKKHDKFHRLE